MPDTKVVIAGAGIGGLAAALSLLQRGIDVEIHEQADEFREVGAGIQIGPNGSRVLLAMGLGPRLEGRVSEAAAKEVRLWNTGQKWPLFDLGEDCVRRFGAPYWLVHRGDLHAALAEAVLDLKSDAVHLGRRCIGVTQDDRGATLQFANGAEARGDIAIGADGVHSVVRDTLWQSPRSQFTGLMAWRGLAPIDRLREELRRPVGTNWIGPGGHIITYPIKDGQVLNIVALVENVTWTKETWTEAGTIEECVADFPGWHPYVQEMLRAVDVPYRWALVGRDPLAAWTKGRVSLLGDACHPTLPFLAQGAIMAIEDGYVLARCLSELKGSPNEKLMQYEQLRHERTAKIVNGSAANTKRFHNPVLADPIRAAEYVEREWEPENVRMRYDWLFEYDPTRPDFLTTSDLQTA